MEEREYKFKIKGATEQECRAVMQALVDIKNAASNQEIITLGNAVKRKPGLVQTALKWL